MKESVDLLLLISPGWQEMGVEVDLGARTLLLAGYTAAQCRTQPLSFASICQREVASANFVYPLLSMLVRTRENRFDQIDDISSTERHGQYVIP